LWSTHKIWNPTQTKLCPGINFCHLVCPVGCQYQTHPTTTTITTTLVWTFLMKKTSKQTKGTRCDPPPPPPRTIWDFLPMGGARQALLSRYSSSNISVPSISCHVTNYFHNFTRIEFSMRTKSIALERGPKSTLEICNLILDTYPQKCTVKTNGRRFL
jgi:hypothetical protein